jgi:hypothetical protein
VYGMLSIIGDRHGRSALWGGFWSSEAARKVLQPMTMLKYETKSPQKWVRGPTASAHGLLYVFDVKAERLTSQALRPTLVLAGKQAAKDYEG